MNKSSTYRRPIVQFEPSADQLIETDSGYEIEKSLGWVKFSADFRKEMLRTLKGAKLGVFLCICLHLNESGDAFPGIDLIAQETDYDRDTVMIAIREMEKIPNLLNVLRERGKSNHYRPFFVARGKNNNPKLPVGKSDQSRKSRLPPVQKIPTTTSPENPDSKERVIKREKKKKETAANVVVVKARHTKKKTKPTTTTSSPESKIKNPFYDQNLIMCERMSITQPQAHHVSNAMPLSGVSVTPEHIKQHVETLATGETIGLAIIRIKAGEMPRDYKPGTIIEPKDISTLPEARRYNDWMQSSGMA